jgi:hypothetical protein
MVIFTLVLYVVKFYNRILTRNALWKNKTLNIFGFLAFTSTLLNVVAYMVTFTFVIPNVSEHLGVLR